MRFINLILDFFYKAKRKKDLEDLEKDLGKEVVSRAAEDLTKVGALLFNSQVK